MHRTLNFVCVLCALCVLPVTGLHAQKPRERDLKLPIGGTAGPLDAITDVAGVEVGHTTLNTGSGKLVAIPWRLLSRASGDQFTATVDRLKLESAPTFSSAAWPTMDSAWMQRVYSHFGVDATGTGAPGSSSGTGTGLGNPATPGLPSTPGTPDITPPSPGTRPSTTPGTTPGTPGIAK